MRFGLLGHRRTSLCTTLGRISDDLVVNRVAAGCSAIALRGQVGGNVSIRSIAISTISAGSNYDLMSDRRSWSWGRSRLWRRSSDTGSFRLGWYRFLDLKPTPSNAIPTIRESMRAAPATWGIFSSFTSNPPPRIPTTIKMPPKMKSTVCEVTLPPRIYMVKLNNEYIRLTPVQADLGKPPWATRNFHFCVPSRRHSTTNVPLTS